MTSPDPLYLFLADETRLRLRFLLEEFAFRLESRKVTAHGFVVTFRRDDLRLEVWAEKGGPPEIDWIEGGRRRSLATLFDGCPLPPLPPFSGPDVEREFHRDRLIHLAAALRSVLDRPSTEAR